jgi:glycosyltransferase involved in cell wall biosynthesis
MMSAIARRRQVRQAINPMEKEDVVEPPGRGPGQSSPLGRDRGEDTDGDFRVLLISPLRGLDPSSGDVTFTEQLLTSAPVGFRYTTYAEALSRGDLLEIGSREHIAAVRGWERTRALPSVARRKTEYAVRRSGVAYREPVRVFRVRPGAFDLVHVHVFHTKFLGTHPPVVMSGGGPMRWLYEGAFGWPEWRLVIADAFDQAVSFAWGATLCAVRLGQAERFIAPNEQLRQWLVTRGWDTERIDVVHNFLAEQPSLVRHGRQHPRVLGFVAKDFDAKGGPLVLAAFERLRRNHPDLRLVIVGSEPRHPGAWLEERGITWHPPLQRSKLLESVLPQIDILVYPSGVDTGVPFSTLEPLALGIPVVVSDYRGLPDLVEGGAGRVARREVESVEKAVEDLLESQAWASASAAARKRFREAYSAETQVPRLRAIYDRVIREGGGRPAR